MSQTKLTAVVRPQNQEVALKSEGYLVMEDWWIQKSDKYVKNERTGKIHKVVAYKSFETYLLAPERQRIPAALMSPEVSNHRRTKITCIMVSDQHQIQIGDKLEVVHDSLR